MKAIIPIAGFGTRFLPASKSMPKEMATIVDRPVIDYVVAEAIASGITDILFVTSRKKRSVNEYFERDEDLEKLLIDKNKFELLKRIRNTIPNNINISYVYQEEQLGLGHAILQGKDFVGHESFVVLLPDVIINSKENHLKTMIASHRKFDAEMSIILTEIVEPSKIDQYGIVVSHGHMIHSIVEKPPIGSIESREAVVGRYVFAVEIMEYLEKVKKDNSGEIQLTSAIQSMINNLPLSTYLLSGKSYDCGSKSGFVKANIDFALLDNDIKSEIIYHMELSV